MTKPRLGHINFINCLALYHGLTAGGFGAGLDIRPDIPANLNRLVVAGELDVSPVSSITYALNPDKLLILPGLSISAPAALESIVVVSRRPLTDLGGCRVALTAKSATSHGLLKIILHFAYKITPDYFVSSASLDDGVLNEAAAALFIGDDALTAYHSRQPGLYYYDLGAEWRKLTGQPMVYALWVANRAFAASRPADTRLVHERVTGAFAYGLSNLTAAAATLAGKTSLSAAQICHYIGLLDYRLDEPHLKALTTYYSLAREIGLLAAVPPLAFAEVGP